MATQSPDAKHVRAYARSQGHEIGARGLIPEHLWTLWEQAGHPWAAGGTKPEGWEPAERNANGNRPVRVHGRGRGKKATAPKAEVIGAFHQPVDPPIQEASPNEVDLVVSGRVTVLTDREAAWFLHTKGQYLEGNAFTEIADLQDLDRLLQLELQVFRLGQWLAVNEDYNGYGIDVALYQKQLKDLSAEIARLKDSMGMSVKARAAQAESVAEKWADLARRAKQWNYHRVDQLRVALRLMNHLASIVRTYERSDEEERRKLGFNSDREIIEWIRDEMLPEYDAVDEHFRNNVQATWARRA